MKNHGNGTQVILGFEERFGNIYLTEDIVAELVLIIETMYLLVRLKPKLVTEKVLRSALLAQRIHEMQAMQAMTSTTPRMLPSQPDCFERRQKMRKRQSLCFSGMDITVSNTRTICLR